MNEITLFDVGIFTIAIIALCLSIYNTWKQHYIRGADVNPLKENIEATYTLIGSPSIMYEGGYIDVDLIFYNSGDRMSIIKINSLFNDKLHLKTDPLAIRESIPPHEHKMISIKGNKLNYTKSILNGSPPKELNSITIEYFWTKKGKTQSVKEDIPLKCIIKGVQ